MRLKDLSQKHIFNSWTTRFTHDLWCLIERTYGGSEMFLGSSKLRSTAALIWTDFSRWFHWCSYVNRSWSIISQIDLNLWGLTFDSRNLIWYKNLTSLTECHQRLKRMMLFVRDTRARKLALVKILHREAKCERNEQATDKGTDVMVF